MPKSKLRKRRRTRLLLEPLEDRCLPAPYTPKDFHDSFNVGKSSLRDVIAKSNTDQSTTPYVIQLKAGIYDLTLANPTDPNTQRSLQDNSGSSGDLDIAANKHRLTIRGTVGLGGIKTTITAADLLDRVFQITKPGYEVVFQDLIIRGGEAFDDGSNNAAAGTTEALGGAILNTVGATIRLNHVIIENNVAIAGDGAAGAAGTAGQDGFAARGGGIYSTGRLTVHNHSLITSNQVFGGAGGVGGDLSGSGGHGGLAEGGGIYYAGVGATGMDIEHVEVSFNTATGGVGGMGGKVLVYTQGDPLAGTGGTGGFAAGGGVFSDSASPDITGDFHDNFAIGGQGGDGGINDIVLGQGGFGGSGGEGSGGALYVSHTGPTKALIDAAIHGNAARGGVGGRGADGSDLRLPVNDPDINGADGGQGGGGEGGGITLENAAAAIDSSTITENEAQGADGGRGGDASGDNIAGGQGGNAGDAMGAGVFILGPNSSAVMNGGSLSNNTAFCGRGGRGGNGITGDEGQAGQGANGGRGGQAFGGGAAAVAADLSLINVLANGNAAIGGDGGAGGNGGSGNTHDYFGTLGGILGLGGNGGAGGSAQGGGIYATDQTNISLSNAPFMSSFVLGGDGGNAGHAGDAPDGDGSLGGQGGDGGAAQGGGIYIENAGTAVNKVVSSLIAFGQIFGGRGGDGGRGGHAAEDEGGSGGTGGAGGNAQGAGVFAADVTLKLASDIILANLARGGMGGNAGAGGAADDDFGGHGGNGGVGGWGQGGGLFAQGGTVRVLTDTLMQNAANGNDGGTGGAGGTGEDDGGFAGHGGTAGSAEGGGIIAQGTTLSVTASTIANNSLQAGDGGDGGPGGTGTDGPGGNGGDGGQAGAAHGGGLMLLAGGHGEEGGPLPQAGTAVIANSTISSNKIRSGNSGFGGAAGPGDEDDNGGSAGNQGGGATKEGGGIFLRSGTLTMQNATIAFNRAEGSNGSGGGVFNLSGAVNAFNTLIAKDAALQGPDFDGAFAVAINNLIEDPNQASNVFAAAGNIVGVDPKLGPLADNGGPTWTHALLKGSPAINHGDNSNIPAGNTDQRGFSRIVGGTVDIGAYEYLALANFGGGLGSSASGQLIRQMNWIMDVTFAAAANTWAGRLWDGLTRRATLELALQPCRTSWLVVASMQHSYIWGYVLWGRSSFLPWSGQT